MTRYFDEDNEWADEEETWDLPESQQRKQLTRIKSGRRHQFVMVPYELIDMVRDGYLKASEFTLWCMLRRAADWKTHQTTIDQQGLCRMANCGRTAMFTYLRKLEDEKLIHVDRKSRYRTVLTVLDPQ